VTIGRQKLFKWWWHKDAVAMDPTSNQEHPQSKRSAAIARLIETLRANRNPPDEDAAVIDAHPDLMPQLKHAIDKLRRVQAAARDAATVDENLHLARMLALDIERPAIEVPGYSVLREIGRGGQAVVYLAIQLSTGQKVALKLTRDGPFADARSLARFQREVQILAALNHPNIVTIIDTGQAGDGSRYIAMKYISGFGLSEYMQRRQKKDNADPGKLLRLFLRICDAVNAAHRQGIVHRDLKPGNIRVDDRGEPHILDFGLARTALDRFVQQSHQPISITGEFLGSLPWSSPEQAQGDPDKIDLRTDVYSLGVILYQMLTGGRFPYTVVGNIRDVLNNILTSEPTPPSKILATAASPTQSPPQRPIPIDNPLVINEAIEKIVLKALCKNPNRRYQSAGELGRDVANYLSGRRTQARDAAEPKLVRPNLPKFKRYATISAGLLVVCAIFATPHMCRPDRSAVLPGASAAGLNLTPSDVLPTAPAGKQWDLIWNDEFNGAVLDPGKWTPRAGVGPEGETLDPAAVAIDRQGHLVINITTDAGRLTTGNVSTSGKFEYAFGYFVCRVLFQEEPGGASAFRLQRQGDHIDVFDKQRPGVEVEQALEIDHFHKRRPISLSGTAGSWHTLAVWCKPNENIFYVDGRESWRETVTDPSAAPKTLVVAGGADRVRSATIADGDDSKHRSDSFLIDYVRVYAMVEKRPTP
jgi:serine/threonine protein kinase